MCLLFQFENDIWAVSLNKKQIVPVLDSDSLTMKTNYLVRRSQDKSQVYCLAERGTRDEVIRLKLHSDDVVRVETIFESSNAHLLAIEADPEDSSRLFLVSD